MNRRNQGQQGQSRRQFQSSQHLKGNANTTHWNEDADIGFMGSSDYRDPEYDLDRPRHVNAQRSSQAMGQYDDYETSDRSQRAAERQAASSERFGYPSSMNSWTHTGAAQAPSWSSEGTSQTSGFFGKGPKGYRRSDDRIKEDVCETLSRNTRVDASDIEVKVEDACVTLSGTVESKEIRRVAEMAIENISGVADVRNELRVKRADDSMYASSAGARNTKSSTTSTKGPGHF